MEPWLISIERLKAILHQRPDLRVSLETSIQQAGFTEVKSLIQFYELLHRMLTEIPTQRKMGPDLDHFHYIVSSSPDNVLNRDTTFRQWLVTFAHDHGSFLDSIDSARSLDTFINNPAYHIEDYGREPSGWLTFNQFFARKVKPGKRPVAEICNDQVIVSPVDAVYLGCWNIDDEAAVTAKGVKYSIAELLAASPYRDVFAGGVFTHCYLDTNDYHRYHVPVRGVVKEARVVPGDVIVEMAKEEDGKLTAKDEVGFQWRQTRGVVVVESPVGWVALLPVGVGHVSSVNFTVDPGTRLTKGEEFGYFCYGGSDMILLFQKGAIGLTINAGKHYKQGEAIGKALKT
jgi:phosphatidylserine decarboxylase precursor